MIDTRKFKTIPKHIAIIMDGNGRWAKSQGLPRVAGHRKGVEVVKEITEVSSELGIKTLTLYTFSSENWNRPKLEVEALMKLLIKSIDKEIKNLIKNNIVFNVIGDLSNFPNSVKNKLNSTISKTNNNTGLNLILALGYGSRQEIISAVKSIVKDVIDSKITTVQINQEYFSKKLHTKNFPDPDLLIRTGGEYRISNFMLWQIAYTELYVSNKYWPEFNKNNFLNIINEYNNRERRFGKV